jgi:hypothetical protein
MKTLHLILPLMLSAPLLASAAQRIDGKPLSSTRMTGRLTFASLNRASAKVELGAEKTEAARLETGPKLRPMNARRGTVELRTQNIRSMQKKKKTIDITND